MGWFLVTYGMTSSSAYYYTKVMSELFLHTPSDTGVSFQAISSMVDFWDVSMTSLLSPPFQWPEGRGHRPGFRDIRQWTGPYAETRPFQAQDESKGQARINGSG